jgi:hypothetical protein
MDGPVRDREQSTDEQEVWIEFPRAAPGLSPAKTEKCTVVDAGAVKTCRRN